MKKILLGDELLIIFARIGVKTFAIDIQHVVSVLEPHKLRRVPLAPSCINTIMNYQGNIITIFDLREFFSCGRKREVSKERKVIYLKQDNTNIGLIVDQVIKVDYMSPNTLEPLKKEVAGAGGNPDFSKGFFSLNDDSPTLEWLDAVKIQKFLREFTL